MEGGYWAYYQFDRLKKIDTAYLERTTLEIQQQEFQRSLNEFPGVKISINPSIIETTSNDEYFIKINASLVNSGSSSVRINFEEDSFSIMPVNFDKGKTPEYERALIFPMPASDDPSKRINALTLRPNHSRDLTTIVKVEKPGFYHIKFYAHQSEKEEKKILEQFGKIQSTDYRGIRWGSSQTIYVKQ